MLFFLLICNWALWVGLVLWALAGAVLRALAGACGRDSVTVFLSLYYTSMWFFSLLLWALAGAVLRALAGAIRQLWAIIFKEANCPLRGEFELWAIFLNGLFGGLVLWALAGAVFCGRCFAGACGRDSATVAIF